jgi:hypothetical protein
MSGLNIFTLDFDVKVTVPRAQLSVRRQGLRI